MVDRDTLAVIRIDPATGTQSVVTSGGLISHPLGLGVDASSGEIYVANFGSPQAPLGNVVAIDPVTTEQRLLASGGPLFPPVGLSVGPTGDVFVTEQDTGSLVRVQPRTGSQTLVAQFINDATGPPAVAANGLVYVGAAQTVIGVDPSQPIQMNQFVATVNQLLTDSAVAATADTDGSLLVLDLDGRVVRVNPQETTRATRR